MRQLILLFLAFSLLISPVWAQNSDADLYAVTDVAVDVTADSSAHARDQAIIQAQRTAFAQLADRVGVEPSVATKLSDDDLATLVQSFEVQEEHTSSVRYIGTFTVQFRPVATHTFLASKGASFNITRSKPVVVLPIVNANGHRVLWEETTKWRSAWETASHSGGLVPVIVPGGDLDDIAVISTEEAANGKTSSIKALLDKYQADGAVVATLNYSDAAPNDGFRIDVQNYDSEGHAQALTHITLPTPADKNVIDATLVQGLKQIRAQLEKDWKQQSKATAKTTTSMIVNPLQDPTAENQGPQGPMVTLPVTVPLISLAEWAQIRARLNDIAAIRSTNVITLARGATSLELSFTGNLDELRTSLLQQSLVLTKNMADGGWVLRPAEPNETQ